MIDVFWEYMSCMWVFRGMQIVQLFYNVFGWIVYNEVNIFGYIFMKNDLNWVNCRFDFRSFGYNMVIKKFRFICFCVVYVVCLGLL